MAQRLKCLPAMWETWVQSLGWKDSLEKEMTTHSSILAWRIPWIEEPGRLQSIALYRVARNSSDLAYTTEQLHFHFHFEWFSGFPYFLQFKSEFGNKEFMI